MHLASLDNEVFFKKVFTDPEVFRAFVRDVAGVDVPDAKIETEKQMDRPVSAIKFKLDIYAESADHRILIEIQRIDYDHNFHRFLHYFLAALIDQQRTRSDYDIPQEVYAIIVITAPYVVKERTGKLLKDDVLVTDLNPRSLQDEARDIFPHRLIFLNPNYVQPGTPKEVADWLQLIHESIENPRQPKINLQKQIIQRAAQLADIEKMDGYELEEAKIAEMRKQAKVIYEDIAEQRGREEILLAAYDRGNSPEQISAFVGITIEEVVAILARHGRI